MIVIHTDMGGTTMDRTQIIRNRMAELERELAELAQFGEDAYSNGDVLQFTVDFGAKYGTQYIYVAVKAGGRWHLSGSRSNSNLSWDELRYFWRESHVLKIEKLTRRRTVFER